MTPTVTRTAKPSLEHYKRHIAWCIHAGDTRRCQDCFDLYREASAESWRIIAKNEDRQR